MVCNPFCNTANNSDSTVYNVDGADLCFDLVQGYWYDGIKLIKNQPAHISNARHTALLWFNGTVTIYCTRFQRNCLLAIRMLNHCAREFVYVICLYPVGEKACTIHVHNTPVSCVLMFFDLDIWSAGACPCACHCTLSLRVEWISYFLLPW